MTSQQTPQCLTRPLRGADSISRRGRYSGSNRFSTIEPVRNVQGQNLNPPYETNPVVLVRRQKQIDYGKNTSEYKNFVNTVPKTERIKAHPKTPDRYQKCSRRSWDGQVKVWRLLLHAWEPNNESANTNTSSESSNLENVDEDEKMA